MRCSPPAFGLALGLTLGLTLPAPGAAQPVDPMQSPECRQALAALQAHEAASAPALTASGPPAGEPQRTARTQLETLRRQAARACLGSRGDAPLPAQGPARAPIAVPPATGPAPSAPVPLLPARPAAAVPRAEPPLVLMDCDAVGCWASDGSRLHRVGPNLLGPRGFCTAQGVALHCP